MATNMSQFFQVFFEEAAEHLSTMEQLLLGFDLNSPATEDLNAVFRAAHSIKGGAGTFGFKDMAVVTHVLESLLDRVRNHELTLTAEHVDLFLQAKDVIQMQLMGHREGTAVDRQMVESVCAKLQHVASTSGCHGKGENPAFRSEPPSPVAERGVMVSYEINFAPREQTFRRGIRIESLFKELAELGKLTAQVDLSAAPTFDLLDPEICYCRWNISLETTEGEAKVRDIFEFVADEDELQVRIKSLHAGYGIFEGAPGAPADKGREKPKETLSPETVFGRRAYDRDETAPGAFGRRGSDGLDSSIRVNVSKVDRLINQMGELVITQAMLAQNANQLDPLLYASIHAGLAQLERNTRDLQESIMSIRMVPISYAFSRFPRVVRDTAAMLGKQVELKMIGETTELDKSLIEKIADPLTHLVRNSLDHGIERPEARLAAGKEATGVITLSASQQEGKIVIEVADDGAGLNREKILRKAQEQGMPVSDGMSDDEVWQLIFAPGFSTAEVVTDVSGRGVGMDVVLRNVKELGGRVQIKSEAGMGTKFTIRLPLTLAILDGLSVRVGSEVFILPLNAIIESLQPKEETVSTVSGKGSVAHVRGDYLRVIPLYQLFHLKNAVEDPQQGILTIVESDGERVALLVDELVGQQQVVIKSLETNYRKVEGTAGATILGDGRVALILDVGSIISMA